MRGNKKFDSRSNCVICSFLPSLYVGRIGVWKILAGGIELFSSGLRVIVITCVIWIICWGTWLRMYASNFLIMKCIFHYFRHYKTTRIANFLCLLQTMGRGGGGREADKTFSSGKFSRILQKLKCYLCIEGLGSTILELRNSWKTCLPSSPFLVKQSVTVNPLSPKSIKWSDTFKQFVGCCQQIVWFVWSVFGFDT